MGSSERSRTVTNLCIALILTLGAGLSDSTLRAQTDRAHDLRPLWQIHADGAFLLGRVIDVARHPEGAFLLLDAQLSQIHVLDEHGRWQRTIGREGEGPGEFRRAASVYCDAKGAIVVLQSAPLRIVRFSLTGEPLEDLRLDLGGSGGIRAISGLLPSPAHERLYVFEEVQTDFTKSALLNTSRLVSLDQETRTRRLLTEHVHELVLARRLVREDATSPFLDRWTLTTDGALVHLADYSQYHARRVSLIDESAVEIRRPDVEPRPRDAHELEELRKMREAQRGGTRLRYEPSPTDQALIGVVARESGEFWLLRDPGGMTDEVEPLVVLADRYDASCRRLGEVRLHGPHSLVGQQFYLFDEVLVAIDTGSGDDRSERAMVSAWRFGALDE